MCLSIHSGKGPSGVLSQPNALPHSRQNCLYSGVPPHSEQDEAEAAI